MIDETRTTDSPKARSAGPWRLTISTRPSLVRRSVNWPCEPTSLSAPSIRSDLGADESEQELTEVHAQIIRLQRTLGSHQLDDLAIYVSALRQRVEECLA